MGPRVKKQTAKKKDKPAVPTKVEPSAPEEPKEETKEEQKEPEKAPGEEGKKKCV